MQCASNFGEFKSFYSATKYLRAFPLTKLYLGLSWKKLHSSKLGNEINKIQGKIFRLR
jgi:hypothetical protein